MRSWTLKVVAIGLLMISPALLLAGNDKAKGRGNDKPAHGQTLTITPDTISSNPDKNSVEVCVAGFSEGNFVSITWPWNGIPPQYSVITYNQLVDSSGGFCINAPDGYTMNLIPGTYAVKVSWYRSQTSTQRRSGPTGTLTVN